jgi:hypothetical protein
VWDGLLRVNTRRAFCLHDLNFSTKRHATYRVSDNCLILGSNQSSRLGMMKLPVPSPNSPLIVALCITQRAPNESTLYTFKQFKSNLELQLSRSFDFHSFLYQLYNLSNSVNISVEDAKSALFDPEAVPFKFIDAKPRPPFRLGKWFDGGSMNSRKTQSLATHIPYFYNKSRDAYASTYSCRHQIQPLLSLESCYSKRVRKLDETHCSLFQICRPTAAPNSMLCTI